MTEEKVTLTIIKNLQDNGWKILSFDYPQSGTGRLIKPDSKEKNLGGFIPDIVAIKKNKVFFWENKDRFVYEDFVKIKEIKNSEYFIEPIKQFLSKENWDNLYFGISIPDDASNISKASRYFDHVDFFVVVKIEEKPEVIYNSTNFNIFI
jgi:hypothetical protein